MWSKEDTLKLNQLLEKQAIIRKQDDGYSLYAKKKGPDGKRRRLGGPYATRAEAEKRERQVNYWKHKK